SLLFCNHTPTTEIYTLSLHDALPISSFALNMAVAAAREETYPVAFFSLEMSNDELVQRLICAEAQISMHDMRRGNIKTHHWEKIDRKSTRLNSSHLVISYAVFCLKKK